MMRFMVPAELRAYAPFTVARKEWASSQGAAALGTGGAEGFNTLGVIAVKAANAANAVTGLAPQHARSAAHTQFRLPDSHFAIHTLESHPNVETKRALSTPRDAAKRVFGAKCGDPPCVTPDVTPNVAARDAAKYLFGGNAEGESMAMTMPVETTTRGGKGGVSRWCEEAMRTGGVNRRCEQAVWMGGVIRGCE